MQKWNLKIYSSKVYLTANRGTDYAAAPQCMLMCTLEFISQQIALTFIEMLLLALFVVHQMRYLDKINMFVFGSLYLFG